MSSLSPTNFYLFNRSKSNRRLTLTNKGNQEVYQLFKMIRIVIDTKQSLSFVSIKVWCNINNERGVL